MPLFTPNPSEELIETVSTQSFTILNGDSLPTNPTNNSFGFNKPNAIVRPFQRNGLKTDSQFQSSSQMHLDDVESQIVNQNIESADNTLTVVNCNFDVFNHQLNGKLKDLQKTKNISSKHVSPIQHSKL